MENIKVSVIVPIFNTEKFLRKCIESIVKQTLQEIEIILINDGSTDNSHIICLEYKEKYPQKIRYINNRNIGCSATRNLGIDLAKGEYITFVDSDDYIEKEMYEEMYKKAKKEKVDIIISGITYVNLIENKKKFFVPKVEQKSYKYLNAKNKPAYVWNKLFRKNLIIEKSIRFPLNTHYCEDLVFSFKAMSLTNKICSIKKSYYNYINYGGNSIYNLEKRLDLEESFINLYNFLEKYKSNIKLIKMFYKNFYYSGIKCSFFILLNPTLISQKKFYKYNKLFYKTIKNLKFLDFKGYILLVYYKNLVWLIRKFNLYFFLKKIKNIRKRNNYDKK